MRSEQNKKSYTQQTQFQTKVSLFLSSKKTYNSHYKKWRYQNKREEFANLFEITNGKSIHLIIKAQSKGEKKIDEIKAYT